MSEFAKKVILYSESDYSDVYDPLLSQIIEQKVLLFCSVGKDCELWHDIMDEMLVGDGSFERDFFMITTWHTDESLAEVVEFAKSFNIDHPDNETVQVIRI